MQYNIYHIYSSERNVFYVARKNLTEVGRIPEGIFLGPTPSPVQV